MQVRYTQGIALIQVLFLSVILSVFLVSVMAKVQLQVQQAFQAQNRAEVMLRLHSLEADTLFALLTHDRRLYPESSLQLPRQWNFHDQPIPHARGQLQLQDMSGLASLFNIELLGQLLHDSEHSTLSHSQLAEQLQIFSQAGYELMPAQHAYIQADSMPRRRSSAVQQVHELTFLPAVSPERLAQNAKLITLYPARTLNPTTMPYDLLRYYVTEPVLSEVIRLRESNELTSDLFSDLTGIEQQDSVIFYPGRGQRLRFTAEINNVKLHRQMVVTLTPHQADPFTIWEYSKYHD